MLATPRASHPVSAPSRDRRPGLLVAALATALILVSALPAAAQIQPACLAVIDPISDNSPLGRPGGLAGVPFPINDQNYIHSATLFQGERRTEKWSGTLVYRPPVSTGFGGFTSALVVNNGDAVLPACVEIDYFTETGGLPIATSVGITIPPNGFYTEAATPLDGQTGPANGVGSARIRVVPCQDGTISEGIVGATLLHSRELFDLTDPDNPPSTQGLKPGMSSMQQLQLAQDSTTELWWGPIPLTQSSPTDFFNGAAPFLTAVNPNGAPTTVSIEIYAWDRVANTLIGPLPWRTVTLPPFGSITEFTGPHLTALGTPAPGLWNYITSLYSGGFTADLDVVYRVFTTDGGSILGDGVITDVYKNGLQPAQPSPVRVDEGFDFQPVDADIDPIGNLQLGKRFRMASTMLFNNPAWILTSPDNSTQTGAGSLVRLLGGVTNLTGANVAVGFEYFSRNRVPISTGSITLAPGQSVRIEPGAPGYPASRAFGWIRVRTCNPSQRVIGWTGHEILDTPPFEPHYHKAFAQAFVGINGPEPGPGFTIFDPAINQTVTRKVAPINRTLLSFPWPGYMTFVNNSVANIGPYRWQFYASTGFNCTAAGPGLVYAGLPFGWTSTTYVDPEASCSANLMGTADHTTGRIEGSDVIGDPFDEWGIPGFAGRWFPPEPLPPFPN
ncbi:MAG: hypothetical protein MI919_02540 [Holophagales bacterium]|nr:hypothetical protein [Holophagales bacterium]